MKKDDPHPTSAESQNHEPKPRLQLVTWKQDEARLERARRERVRKSRSIYIPPFPVVDSYDPVRLRWKDGLPSGLLKLN